MGTYKTNEEEFKRLHRSFLLTIKNTRLTFRRYLTESIDWSNRFIAIRGARGCGKTTFLYQYIKTHLPLNEEVIYANLDDIYFTTHRLIDFAEDFVINGGKYLFLDEVHKYPTWSLELKTIYDTYHDLKIIFTSSSILEVYKGNADLSRRLVCYDMEGLSFREFLLLEKGISLKKIPLEEIIKNHIAIAMEITADIKIIPLFRNYLEYGHYPFFMESKMSYHAKLANTINLILETDLPAINKIEYGNIYKLKKLLSYLAMNGPYKPDITKLSGQIEVSRNTLLLFLDYLKSSKAVNLLKTDKSNESVYTKPEKVYLHNTNLLFAIGGDVTDTGVMREIFFFNQLSAKHKVGYTEKGDFLVNNKYTFEIGGKKKGFEQVKEIKESFIAADGIEVGYKEKIPLWLFGLMY